ncbi:MAG TPA: hypothetical protein VHG92_04465, partial [Afifellaceae bacterium]|nr:hypothetical protein [Afifellaceae bacterium]
ALYGRAYSRFAETQYSLMTLMSGEVPAQPEQIAKYNNPVGYEMVLRNAWLEKLKKKGYQIDIYGTMFVDFCSNSEHLINYCYYHPMLSIDSIQRASLEPEVKAELIARAIFQSVSNITKHHVPLYGPISAMQMFDQFENEFFKQPNGVAYIVHVLIPHQAYIYDSECQIREKPSTWLNASIDEHVLYNTAQSREERYRLYFPQVHCITARLVGFFDRMKREGLFDDAIIVVHGDHGARIATERARFTDPGGLSERDVVDHFSTLFAVKAPHVAPGYRRDLRSIQSLFAEMFLDREAPPEEDDDLLIRTLDARRGQAFLSRDMVEFGASTGPMTIVGQRAQGHQR